MPVRSDDPHGLRLAAKAADRMTAAQQQWPAFEQRLTELGYPPAAIRRAFGALSGPGTVAEALNALTAKGLSKRWVALPFEVFDDRVGFSHTDGFTVTCVERNNLGVRVEYEHVFRLALGIDTALASRRPWGGAKDDLGNEYDAGASHTGLLGDGEKPNPPGATRRVVGGFTLALPVPEATMLRIRIGWGLKSPSVWQGAAREFRVLLPT